MKTKSARNQTLTEGVIWKQLILFALPLLGSSLIQQLYNTVDLIFVGRILGKEASAAVGSGSLMITCLIGFFTGLSVGISVITGKFFGAQDQKSLYKTIHTAVVICLVSGVVLLAVGVGGAPFFLRLLNTPKEILPLGVVYMRIYFCSIFSILFFNVSAGILRATGDSKNPMLYQLAGGIANVFANYLFIVVFHMGVAGAAFATMVSQSVAAILTVRRLTMLPEEYRLCLKKISFDKKIFKQILLIGIPSGIQSMVITLSNLIVQSNINSLDVNSIAAFVAYFKVELFLYLPIQAFGQASMTFVSQNIGAGKLKRARKGMWTCIGVGVLTTICMAMILLMLPSYAFSMFSRDAAVITAGISLIQITFPFYFIYVFLEVFSCTIRGTGRGLAPMIIILVNLCGLRIILVNVMMKLYHSAPGVALIYPITWGCAAVCLYVYYRASKCLE